MFLFVTKVRVEYKLKFSCEKEQILVTCLSSQFFRALARVSSTLACCIFLSFFSPINCGFAGTLGFKLVALS
jgi:hypothetical protein